MTPGPGSSRRTADGTALRHTCAPVPAQPAGLGAAGTAPRGGGRVEGPRFPGGSRRDAFLRRRLLGGRVWGAWPPRAAAVCCSGPGLGRVEAEASCLPWARVTLSVAPTKRPGDPVRPSAVGSAEGQEAFPAESGGWGTVSSPYSRTLRCTQLCASAGWTSGMC